ncbi:Protein BPS1, chloroplastic [Glycine soja]|uniref:Protein BPS1, chloroplastic n=1 Tax=Glycine soja TaxID=3848 RepID=A0A0B2S4C0_GLYSO|nr:Protein BPS1, chloroplastic [Glycine soja]
MTLAMKSLCESHNDIWTLMTALELRVSDWEDKWIDVYFDISSKLLDICNAFSSELSRLNQGNLPLKCALHNLDSASSKQYLRACSLLDDWRQHVSSRNPRIEKCSSMLDNLVGSLDLPKVKNSAKGKVLMQAMYGVKVETVFICRVFTAAFSGSSKKLSDLNAGVDTVETEWLVKTVEELRASAEKLSQGIDLLAKGVDEFFQAVMTSRDTLLSSVSSTHFCKWHGGTCSLNHQRVSALNLQGYALRGLITPEIDVPRNQVWLQEFV